MGLSGGEGCGLELPGNLTSPKPPHSIRVILCAPAPTSALSKSVSPEVLKEPFPHASCISMAYCSCLGAEGFSLLLKDRPQVLLTGLPSLRHSCGWQNAHTPKKVKTLAFSSSSCEFQSLFMRRWRRAGSQYLSGRFHGPCA